MTTELLSPAGTLKSMRYAFAYGADAVYAGQPRYSLRVRNNEFNKLENLAAAVEEAHGQGRPRAQKRRGLRRPRTTWERTPR